MNAAIVVYISFLLALLALALPIYPNADVLNARVCAFYVDTCYLTGCTVSVPDFCSYGEGLASSSTDAGHSVPTLSRAVSGPLGPVFEHAHWTD